MTRFPRASLLLLIVLASACLCYSQSGPLLPTTVADADYTVLNSDATVIYTSITAARTVTLPTPAASNKGRLLRIKDSSGTVTSTNKITLSGTVDGTSNPAIIAPYGYLTLVSNGTTWSAEAERGTTVATLTDGAFFVPPQNCFAAVSGTAGTGNNTIVIDGSVPALKASSTNAGASNATFTCTFTPPSRLAAGRGAVINDITYLYGVQTTTATSMVASTFNSFTAPAAGTAETASSATLVAAGGSLTQLPVVGSANLTAVSAGQYYSEKITLGTPEPITTDLKTYVFTFQINQSASAAQIVTCPGIWVHYQLPALL